jgi:peptide/nickel transport system permease protein
MPPGRDWTYPLGTDVLGRDMLSRLIHGARTTVLVSFVALTAGAIVGTVLGLISGNEGGRLDALIMRFTDATLAFPSILVAMIVVVLTGAGVASIIVAVTLTGWPRYSRMIRGEALSIKQLDFVTAARVVGCSRWRIIARHVFPSVVNTLLIIASLQVPQVILLEASLSFLGLGLPPGAASWGVMVAEGRAVILDDWWLSLWPGLAITMVVLAFNFFGDWLRDTLDPRLRHV